jgi:fatty-acyl-CoA synthase
MRATLNNGFFVGERDKKYGEEVCAWIRFREGHEATADEVRDFCSGHIARHQIPRYMRSLLSFR